MPKVRSRSVPRARATRTSGRGDPSRSPGSRARKKVPSPSSSPESEALADPAIIRLAADTVRKAQAVGLVDEAPDAGRLTYADVRRAVARVGEAGVAGHAARSFERADPADRETIARDLARIEALIDETPFPESEWRRLRGVFDRDRLAALVGISPASVGRYARGARSTRDEVAARLHFLALVVGDLAGAYNEIGIRRWFDRPRTPLEGRAPAEFLSGAWRPEDPGPARVRALARALVESPAT